MAVSLALNWSPPPSSPLLDEMTLSPDSLSLPTSETGEPAAARTARNASLGNSLSPFPATSSASPSTAKESKSYSSSPNTAKAKITSNSPGGAAAAAASNRDESLLTLAGTSLNGNPPPGVSSALTNGRSYAAAASSQPPPSASEPAIHQPSRSATAPAAMSATLGASAAPQIPPLSVFSSQPAFNGALAYGVHTPLLFPPQAAGPQAQFQWMQYQQMLAQHQQAQQQHLFHKGVGVQAASKPMQHDPHPPNRRRTASGPQLPGPLTYNDTFAQAAYPGQHSFAATLKSNLLLSAPSSSSSSSGAAPSSSHPHSSGSSSASSSQGTGYHPYRRTARGSDTGPSSSQASASASGGAFPSLPHLADLAAAGTGVGGAGAGVTHPSRARTSSNGSPSNGSDALLDQLRKGSLGSGSSSAETEPLLPTSYSAAAASSLRGAGASQAHAHNYSKSPLGIQTSPAAAAMNKSPSSSSLNTSRQQQQRQKAPSALLANGTAAPVKQFNIERRPPPALNGRHGRDESLSSQGSQHSAGSGGGSGQASASGCTTPTPAAAMKKPSPLCPDHLHSSSSPAGGAGLSSVAVVAVAPVEESAANAHKKTPSFGKLRRALSFSTLEGIQNTQTPGPSANGAGVGVLAEMAPNGRQQVHHVHGRVLQQQQQPVISTSPAGTHVGSTGSTRSSSPPRTPDNVPANLASSGASITSKRSARPPIAGGGEGRRSLFNRKFNSSTDNISLSSKLSISSTVSSASMMLRKVGGLGKLARKSNLMGITNIFNKDKDRDADDRLGASGNSSPGAGAAGSKSKKSKSKKSAAASTFISHATAESDASAGGAVSAQLEGGMTPAAYYVRQMQEAEARAEAAAQAQRQRDTEASAAFSSATTKAKTKTTDDMQGDRQKMIEKEKARLKSKRAGGWRKKIGMGSSSDTQELTGLETTPITDDLHDRDDAQQQHLQHGQQAYGQYAATGVGMPPPGVYTLDDQQAFDAAFDEEELEPPHMPGSAGGGSGAVDSADESETDSLRHWGEGIERSRASASRIKAPKGILKQPVASDIIAAETGKPWMRMRANSYDAPNGPSAGAPLMSQMSNTAAGVDRMDGVARPASPLHPTATTTRGHQRAQTLGGGIGIGAGAPPSGGPSIGHHPNSSMPQLSLMSNIGADGAYAQHRSVAGPPQRRKRLTFAETHVYHSTWPSHVYDRRGELATCNRLTPLLAQRIKEELNTFKMEEMQVAPSSRIFTQFFV
ncbi:hypothetical protein K437DRAFT_125360 [Tilletiaria anomala UBC 951]|uniref:Uncharacterized protein n=1 Tax=Tilletiaria anomala (strain ATCC 24038 / CBS 436.72 / UBC 951) TaxID=1037660 RepID=A0A066W2P8_TILAU|nr:uncharacterized protein K437DRAFT_125360 [Tilletiaria anomala UBC 951]KDN45070.1 hypothetical protein K437DRAFT_125360 [Tilletiaria anomala UBC 951]